MKKIIAKYVLLIVVTFAASIFIYEYIMANKPIDTETDLLYAQTQSEKQYLSNTNYTIDNPNVILNPYGNSPLSALIVFQTKDLTTSTVTIKGKDGAEDLTHTFTPTKVHILPIYGLYAGYDNKVVIEASGIRKEITITTSPLPDDFSKVTDLSNADYETDEFYFTTPEEIGYTAAYDSEGEVRWYLIGDYKWDIQRLNNGHILLSSDKILFVVFDYFCYFYAIVIIKSNNHSACHKDIIDKNINRLILPVIKRNKASCFKSQNVFQRHFCFTKLGSKFNLNICNFCKICKVKVRI